jgi:ABC-type transport system involved in multi-copper enzyme maturation permease subunit
MFKEFFNREMGYALRRPMVYIFLLVFFILGFATTGSEDFVSIAVGNVHKNAPYALSFFIVILSMFGIMFGTAFFNNAALKDVHANFHEILFSKPIKKSGFFFGRFLSALILSTIPFFGLFLGMYLGAIIGPIAGWIEPERLGEFYLETFVNNYLLFVLPNMLFSGAIVFALASKWKSTVITFLGAIIIVIAYQMSGTLLSDIDNERTAALLDIFGVRAYSTETRYFTPIEKNTLSPAFEGLILQNRLIWLTVSGLILALAYRLFSVKLNSGKVKKQKKAKEDAVNYRKWEFPVLNAKFNFAAQLTQFGSFFKINFLSVIKSVTFKILFLFGAILLIVNLIGGFEYYGLQSYPVTYKMMEQIRDVSSLFILIILVFFSGELVWRDRDNKIHEVIDASPHVSFISLMSKAITLVAITCTFYLFFLVSSVLYQLGNGYTNIELAVYLKYFLVNSLPNYFVTSLFLVFMQVLVNNKYIGYFASILYLILSDTLLSAFDISTNMLSIGSTPSIQYSDMNEFGPGLTGAHWFNLYWFLFAMILLFLAGMIWNRGAAVSFKERLQNAPKITTKTYMRMLGLCVFSWLSVGAFTYYNTQVLNSYDAADEIEKLSADYEKKFKKYESMAIPSITDVTYHVDIFPHKRDVYVEADMILVNKNQEKIDSIFYTISEDWNPKITIPNAVLAENDTVFGFMKFALEESIMPGDSIAIKINTKYITEGFENGRGNTNIINNGTFLNNFQILPQIGYNAGYELSDKTTRKKYDLKPKERMPKLEEHCTGKCRVNYLTDGRSDWVNVETFISTASDQVAIAPGSLMKAWVEDDRNKYHYKVDHPSQNFYSFISADYRIATRKWNDVDLEVYYSEKHEYNVEMMLDAIQSSLEYYTENFGPYYHKQARIIEFPRYSTFAQAFPGTMPYSEAFGFIINLEEEDNNVINAVIAHEMAHQWWAHQEVSANMQGATMLTESFSEYSSLMVMKQNSDDMQMKEFLKYNFNRYLRGRSSETKKEVPLYKVENQGYIHYGKGSLILYALQDYIGEERVNGALRKFLNQYAYHDGAYPTSLDFLKILEPEVPDSLQYLVQDWFRDITLYDFRLKDANYTVQEDSSYLIEMDIEAYKIKSDTIGKETNVPVNDWVDVGVYADDDEEVLMYHKRVKFDQEKMTVRFEVDSLPSRAGIDPRRILIERGYNDNSKALKEKES